MDGKQGGDPAKLADALVQVVALEEPPARFAAGADAVDASSARHGPCSTRPTPTGSCPPASPTTTPEPGPLPSSPRASPRADTGDTMKRAPLTSP